MIAILCDQRLRETTVSSEHHRRAAAGWGIAPHFSLWFAARSSPAVRRCCSHIATRPTLHAGLRGLVHCLRPLARRARSLSIGAHRCGRDRRAASERLRDADSKAAPANRTDAQAATALGALVFAGTPRSGLVGYDQTRRLCVNLGRTPVAFTYLRSYRVTGYRFRDCPMSMGVSPALRSWRRASTGIRGGRHPELRIGLIGFNGAQCCSCSQSLHWCHVAAAERPRPPCCRSSICSRHP